MIMSRCALVLRATYNLGIDSLNVRPVNDEERERTNKRKKMPNVIMLPFEQCVGHKREGLAPQVEMSGKEEKIRHNNKTIIGKGNNSERGKAKKANPHPREPSFSSSHTYTRE